VKCENKGKVKHFIEGRRELKDNLLTAGERRGIGWTQKQGYDKKKEGGNGQMGHDQENLHECDLKRRKRVGS